MPVPPASPPKRMTRARAKAVEDKTKTTKVSTAGSRAAAATKTTASKRKTPAEDEQEAQTAAPRPARKVSTKPTLAQSRRGIATKPAAEENATNNAPDAAIDNAAVTKARGRPRKNTVSKDPPAPAQDTMGPSTRTRTRADPVTRTIAAKKKVAFQDPEENKENAAVVGSKNTKSVKPATSVVSKPVRRTASATTTVMGKKPVGKTNSTTTPKARMAPLSPKKETQVAKGGRAEDEDDTGGPSNLADSIDELQIDPGPCVSPKKEPTSVLMASPARRPPPSPFKDAMKGSPRRLDLSVSPTKTADQVAITPPRNMLSQSPRKFNMPFTSKGTVLGAPSSDLGGSFLKSPARRPPSPFKGVLSTPSGPKSVQKDFATSTLASKSPQRFTPAKDLTAAFKAAEKEAIQARLMSIEEHTATLADELFNAPSPFSPVKKALEESNPQEQNDEESNTIEGRETGSAHQGSCDDMDVDNSIAYTPQPAKVAFLPRTPGTPAIFEDESEDELSSDNVFHSTPAAHKTRLSTHFKPAVTPEPAVQSTTPTSQVPQESLTVLAQRFGQWQTSTPNQSLLEQRKATRSVFSPLPHLARPMEEASTVASSSASTPEPNHEAPVSFFDEALPITIHEDENDAMVIDQPEHEELDQHTQDLFRQSQMSDASQIYGDENECPIDPALLGMADAPTHTTQTCTPERVYEERPQVIHTVSKVPLKGCADFDVSPIVMPKKRSQSLAGGLSPHADLELQAMRQLHPSAASMWAEHAETSQSQTNGSDLSQMVGGVEQTPRRTTSGSFVGTPAPARTPRASSSLLKGAIVFVDVHTTEGADASDLFVDLLTQMGAKCVKSWTWSSRASTGGNVAEPEPNMSTTKVGITHVVFKDGGKRTMERVREAHGRVLCVGVGWVLEYVYLFCSPQVIGLTLCF
ncbi:hypothetical protein FH972_021177 [Carpinus fangiana]|uniref:BRCT domain-containing protein n=1 Tax=Carpinus fangiana TaxID=176857 RepID=A0A5N6KP53_9ROSI|nr:hypothetical protein FH972_021177 [Carpinus fangiana]